MLTGNFENNFNKLNIFIDSVGRRPKRVANSHNGNNNAGERRMDG